MSKRHNPKLYRDLSKPFATHDEANASLQAFFADVERARELHKIPDVIVLCEITHGDDEDRGSASMRLGSSLNVLPMLAREYGAARQEHEDLLQRVIAEAKRTTRNER